MNLKAAIEAILFVQGEPLAVSRIAKILETSKSQVVELLLELAEEYREHGIHLVENGDEWQFATSPENKEYVERLVTSELSEELTRAGLEVLAIVAYKGPLTRAEIEYIRGVNSSFTLRNLLLRGLVTREENPNDQRSYLYRVSVDFLKHLGLTRLEELPHYGEFRKQEIEIPREPSPQDPVVAPNEHP